MQSLTDSDVMGLPEHELSLRVSAHRGVFCQQGLILPTKTTVYAATTAVHFNRQLPLGPTWEGRKFLSLRHAEQGTTCARGLEALGQLAALELKGTQGHCYVLQVETEAISTKMEWDGDLLHLAEGINVEAITRMWIAERAADGDSGKGGGFAELGPPNRIPFMPEEVQDFLQRCGAFTRD